MGVVFGMFWIPAKAGMTICGEPTGVVGSILFILSIHAKDKVSTRAVSPGIDYPDFAP